MLLIHAVSIPIVSRGKACSRFLAGVLLMAILCLGPVFSQAQSGQSQPSPTATPAPKSNAPAEAGGPQGDIGPIAVPKKKDEEPKRDEAPKAPKKVDGLDNFSMRISSQLVTLDVGVLSKE